MCFYKRLWFFAILVTISGCATRKLNEAQTQCKSGSKLECARAGVYYYKTGNRDAGYNSLKTGCFDDGLKIACDWFARINLSDFHQAKLDDQRERDEAERERQLELELEAQAAEKKTADDRIDCQKRVEAKTFSSIEACHAAKSHQDFSICESEVEAKTWPGLEKCLWAHDHPIEATCEIEIKQYGGSFWECVNVKYEREEAQEALRLQREAINQQAINSRRDREELARQKKLDRQQRQQEAEQANNLQKKRDRAKAWENIGNSLKGPKRTTCTSRSGSGTVTTECEESR